MSADFTERLDEIRARIRVAAAAAKRDPSDITLIAVSKGHPAAALREAYAHGVRDFGESYAQEMQSKAEELSDLPDLQMHFIGHLQSNKAKLIAQFACAVHAVDTASLARELGRRALAIEKRLPVLVEVNIGGEVQKHGVTPSEIEDLLRAIEHESALELRGLMTIPPNDEAQTKAAFESLYLLRQLHGGATRLPWLSMGMSSDFEWAIASGATHIRVGTALFGERNSH